MYLNINLVNEIKRNQTGKILRSYYKEVKWEINQNYLLCIDS
jgi:hypothetical protein